MQVDDDLCLINDDFPCPAILVNINCFITCKNKKIVCAVLSEIFDFAPPPHGLYFCRCR